MRKRRKAKALVLEQIEREREYLNAQEVGSDDYNKSLSRLNDLNGILADLEDKHAKIAIDIAKVASGFVLTVGGIVFFTANERDMTYTGVAKDFIRTFVPKKFF